MNRERLAWSISLLLVTVLAFRIPGSMAANDQDYEFVRALVDIHSRVSGNYVEPVDQAKLRQNAIDGMLSELDPFSVYIPPAKQEEFDRALEGSFKGVGIQLDQLENGQIEVVTPIDGSPAEKAGVMAGDVILKVNGVDVVGQKIDQVTDKVKGPLGSEVKLTVRHATGEERELAMTREEIIVPTLKGFARKADNTWDYLASTNPKVGYVRVTQFTSDTADKLRDVLTNELLPNGMGGLVLDLRYNPGGRLEEAVKMVNLFVKEGVIVSVKGASRPEQIRRADGVGTLPKFPLVVLVNEHSASASEVVAGSLQDNKRAVVVGQRSYGKGSVQEVMPLDGDGGELKLTVAYYYLPSGRLVHRKKDATDWGVQPQIVVPVDDATQAVVFRDRREAEMFRRPVPRVSTQPTTHPRDEQLDRGVDILTALLVLQDNARQPGDVVKPTATSHTEPATLPAMVPLTRPTSAPSTPTTLPSIEVLPAPSTMPVTRPATEPSGRG